MFAGTTINPSTNEFLAHLTTFETAVDLFTGLVGEKINLTELVLNVWAERRVLHFGKVLGIKADQVRSAVTVQLVRAYSETYSVMEEVTLTVGPRGGRDFSVIVR